MRAFAEESAAAQGDAPRLRALQGYADWDDCVNLSAQRPPRRALELCDRALGAYRASRFLRAKALVLYRSDRFADAVAASTEALEADPFDVDTLVERARAYTQLADWSRGAGDLRVALQLVPAHGQGVALLSWMVEQLDWEARSALSRHEFGEALQAFETMASAFPGVEPFQKTRRAVANRLGPRYAGGQIQ
jgi:tetratricopeptide (TPR) repeat protein